MKITNEEYLRQQLKSKKLMLTGLKTSNQLWIQEHTIRKEMLENDIESLTRQLGDE